MKKTLLLAALLLVLLPPSVQATYVSFDFRFSFDDSSGSNYHLECFDAHTGVLLLSNQVFSGTQYTMKVPKDDHTKILCIVKVYGGPTVGFWRIFPQTYYQGCGGSVIADLPDDTGACGDGAVTGPEKCDTAGNLGCDPASANPRCCRCDYCGCGSDKDCPQVTQPPCGYGKCGPTERPVFTPTCYDCGTCIYPYRCVYDPSCDDNPDNPVETEEAAFPVSEAVKGALSPDQSATFFARDLPTQMSFPSPLLQVNGVLLPEPPLAGMVYNLPDGTLLGILEGDPTAVSFYLMDPLELQAGVTEWQNLDTAVDKTGKENAVYLKSFLKKVLRKTPGTRPTELINLNVRGDDAFKAVSAGRLVKRLRRGAHCSPTMVVRTDLETLEEIFEERISVAEAIAQGRVTVNLR